MALLAACETSGLPGVDALYGATGNDKKPAVIVLPTMSGMSSFVHDFAADLSSKGYVTVVVDPTKKGGVDRIDWAYDALQGHDDVDGGRVGIVGFSMGGTQAVNFASFSHKFTNRKVTAIVSYYPGPDQGRVDRLNPPILIFRGDQDNIVMPAGDLKFCELQQELGTVCEVIVYEGVTHSFTHRSDWGRPDAGAIRDAFSRTVSFLGTYLDDR
jgi:dienelactone hydrolase